MRYKNILHIDDDEDDQEIFLAALRTFTDVINYTASDNPPDAIQQLAAKIVIPDIIFLDLNMPEMNGQQFFMELRKNAQLKQIPVIVLSTSAHFPTVGKMKELGVHDFITKPDNFGEFCKKLHDILT